MPRARPDDSGVSPPRSHSSYPLCTLPLSTPHPLCFHSSDLSTFSLVLRLLLLSLVVSSVCCANADAFEPPGQRHAYFNGVRVSSIAVQPSRGVSWIANEANSRLLIYSSDGHFSGYTRNSDYPFVSLSSVAYLRESAKGPTTEWLFVADATKRAVQIFQLLQASAATEQGDDTRLLSYGAGTPLALPDEMDECGLIVTPDPPGDYSSSAYIVDRYRGRVARYDIVQSDVHRWVSDPPPVASTAAESTANTTYLAAVTATNERLGVLYVVDGVGDRVMRLNASTGEYMDPLLVVLPDAVRGIQAVSWTWCADTYTDDSGCLWLLYCPGGLSGTEQTVTVVSLRDGRVVYNWTTAAADARGAAGADAAVSRGGDGQRQQQQLHIFGGGSAALSSPAMIVIASGVDSYLFRVYLAESDPLGLGQVIVMRDESGALLKRFDRVPLRYDITNHTTHAFSAVQADYSTSTLWLTDVDNGGLLVRAAADGTLLQAYPTPALITFMVLDRSYDWIVSLVVMSVSAGEWQLWRFYPMIDYFDRLNTTAAQRRVNASRCSGARAGSGDMADIDPTADVSASVGGLAVSQGWLLLTLPAANMLVMLNPVGEWDDAFNSSCSLLRPALAVYSSYSVVVADRSGEQGSWAFQVLGLDGSYLFSAPFQPSMSQPLALVYDAESHWLYMSDVNGLLFQLNADTLAVSDGGVFQPMPSAHSMVSLSVDGSGSLLAVDTATRRLIFLYLPVLPSSVSSSSSTGSSNTPVVQSGGSTQLIVGLLSAAAVLICLAVVLWYCWSRRRWASGGGQAVELEGAKADEAEQHAYRQWNDVSDSVSWTVTDSPSQWADSDSKACDVESATGQHASAAGSGKPSHASRASEGRYEAYVRKYESLNETKSIIQTGYEGVDRHRARSEKWSHTNSASSDPLPMDEVKRQPSSSSSSSLSLPSPSSSRHSAGSLFHSFGSSSHSYGSAQTRAALHHPPAIDRLSSDVAPHYIDCVTDLHIVGEGQSGRVYSGYYAGMRVVVKLPKTRAMSAAQWREWQAHLRLPVHPSLVRFVGSLVMCDTNYLVLQWVEQGSLASLLSSPSASSTASWYTRPYGVMRAAADIAAALQHVHRHGLVHRDVSARNVLVDADGTFVLADLGLAVETDGAQMAASATGAGGATGGVAATAATAGHTATAATGAADTAVASVATSITISTAAATADTDTAAAAVTATVAFSSSLATHSSLVTPGPVPLRWCSPEYLSTGRATGKLDVWALGVTLWEMTAGGRLPYSDITDQRWLQQLVTAGVLRLRVDEQWMRQYEATDERGLVGRVARLIDTCMAVDVQRRPAAQQVVALIGSEMAEWEAECAEAAELVKRRWVDDHAAAVPRGTPSAPAAASAPTADEAGQ